MSFFATLRAERRNRRLAAVAGAAIGAVVFGVVVVGWLLVGVSSDPELNVEQRPFSVGRTDVFAQRIAEGGPVLLPDASPNKARDVYLQHLGADPDEGWLAIQAYAPGTAAEERGRCTLRTGRGRGFTDPCTGRRYPRDGAGLVRYPAIVEGGRVAIDLRPEAAVGPDEDLPAQTTSTTSR